MCQWRRGAFILQLKQEEKVKKTKWLPRPGAGGSLQAVGILAVVLLWNGIAWLLFVTQILPHHFRFRGLGIGIGVAVTAWTLGARHAFDADHIAAIDNSTRKLISDGKRPYSTGFFFALGHNTTIMVVGAALAVATKAVFGAVVDPHSAYETTGGVIGTTLSASFLWFIAAINLVILAGLFRVAREAKRRRGLDDKQLEQLLHSRGFLYRFFARRIEAITASWQLYFVGIVFAIGFDTATEVVLLTATATAASQGLPFYAVITLPLLFSGALLLGDSIDGLFMNKAYGWAFAQPARRLFYNISVTMLSVAVAFVIGGIELGGVLVNELHLHGWLADFFATFNINTAGFTVAGMFLAFWVFATLAWRFGAFSELRGEAGQSETE